jgi:hypothetical protein
MLLLPKFLALTLNRKAGGNNIVELDIVPLLLLPLTFLGWKIRQSKYGLVLKVGIGLAINHVGSISVGMALQSVTVIGISFFSLCSRLAPTHSEYQ